MDATTSTKHPDKIKKGVCLDQIRYDALRAAILAAIRQWGEVTFTELSEAMQHRMRGKFAGSVMWSVATVKFDLEARKAIQRGPKSGPQRLRLA